MAIAAILVLGITAWAVATPFVEQVRFAILAPRAQTSIEAAAASARVFGALVLLLFPAGKSGERLLWVAAGLVVLSLGDFGYVYLEPFMKSLGDLETTAYESLMVRTVAGAFLVIGLVPETPPHLGKKRMLALLSGVLIVGAVVEVWAGLLPPLVRTGDFEQTASSGDLPGVTGWHSVLSTIPLALSVAAALAAAVRYRRGTLGGWLLVAMVLLYGSQLHSMFWPSAYTPVLSTADLLRFAFAAMVVVGGVLELRRIATERAKLLAVEKENARRLAELAVLKADFTAMVAHELNSPLAAIRGLADVLAVEGLPDDRKKRALDEIQAETDILNAIVNDVRTAANAEREDFAIEPRAVPLGELLDTVAAFAGTLDGDHPLAVRIGEPLAGRMVWADPDRIGQVLRNLLSNAARYSPAGAPIELRAVPDGERVRIEVADHGPGIRPEDAARIFEKFERGRGPKGRKIAGVGLGLYLSRRIVRSHGAELTVGPAPEGGSVFAFELDTAPETAR